MESFNRISTTLNPMSPEPLYPSLPGELSVGSRTESRSIQSELCSLVRLRIDSDERGRSRWARSLPSSVRSLPFCADTRVHVADCRSQYGHAHRRSMHRRGLDRCIEYDCSRVPGRPRCRLGSSQAEISPPHARGLLSGWTQLMIVWGFFGELRIPTLLTLVANWVGYGCQFLNSSAQWRVPLGIQIVPAVLLLG